MFKIIIIYELFFFLFWNIIYFGADLEAFAKSDVMAFIYIILSTMALGLTVVYIIYVTAKLSGFLDKIRSTKDPRRDIGHQ